MEDLININETTLLTYFSGSASPAEKEIIESWLEQSAENRKLARDVQYLYFAADTLSTIRQTDAPASLKIVKKKIRRNRQVSIFGWCQRIAAILFIPLLLSTTYHLFKEEPVEYIEITTNPGMITAVDLPDGTKVWLNSESTLRRPTKFAGKTREVSLSGEAYFQVAKNDKQKFIVSTENSLKIEVLGTKFNIEAYKNDPYIATTLEEGSVRLSYETPGKEINSLTMIPDQKVIYCKQTGKAEKQEAYVSSDIAWKDRKIILRNTPLEEVLKKLSHRFNVEFIIKKEALKKNSFTGTFDTQQLGQVLEHIRISSDINYRIIAPEPDEKTIQAKSKVILF